MALFESAPTVNLHADLGRRDLEVCVVCLGDGEMPTVYADLGLPRRPMIAECHGCDGIGAWPWRQWAFEGRVHG